MLTIVQKEYRVLDCMKLVMAIIVIANHTCPISNINSQWIKESIEIVYSIAVPFFFLSSGFFLFRKISVPLDHDGEIRLRAYLKRICKLYLIWTFFYSPLTITGFYIDGLSVVKSAVVFIRNLLLVGENFMSWPLWYLLALVVAVGIIYIFLKMKVPINIIVIISFVMALFGIGLDYCRDNALFHSVVDSYFKVFLKTRNGFFVGFLYVSLGALLAKRESISIKFLFMLMLISLFFCSANLPLSESLVSLLIFIVSLLLKGKSLNLSVSFTLRQLSTILYFIHMFFVAILVLIFNYNMGLKLFCLVVSLSFLSAVILLNFQDKALFKRCFK